MKYVLDACIALKTLLKEDGSLEATVLLDDFRHQIHQLIAPDTLPVEISHALTRAERQGVIQKGDAKGLLARFLDTCPLLYPYGDLLDRAMELSSDVRIGVFDCLYVALAEEEQCRVITADMKMVNLFPKHVITMDSI